MDNNSWTEEALLDHLQKAVYLELWTIPLYLTAAYSLQVPGSSVQSPPTLKYLNDKDNNQSSREQLAFNNIYSIAIQEMLHLELAANLFNALFGPKGRSLQFTGDWAPRYDKFPDWIDVKLPVQLGAVHEAQLRLLATVETPEPKSDPAPNGPQAKYDSIGQFYKAIQQGIDALWDKLYDPASLDHRQKNDFADDKYKNDFYDKFSVTISGDAAMARKQADGVIQAIIGEGEGSFGPFIPEDLRPEDHADLEDRVSHFARFRLVQAMLKFGGPLKIYSLGPQPENDAIKAAQKTLNDGFSELLGNLEQKFATRSSSLGFMTLQPMWNLPSQIVAVWAAGGVPAFRA